MTSEQVQYSVVLALVEKIERMNHEWSESIRLAHAMHEPVEAKLRAEIDVLTAKLKRKGDR